MILSSEKGNYSSAQELMTKIDSVFSQTVACLGNPALEADCSAIKVIMGPPAENKSAPNKKHNICFF